MDSTLTEADFERLTWHDNHLYGLRLAIGDPDQGDWRADLEQHPSVGIAFSDPTDG